MAGVDRRTRSLSTGHCLRSWYHDSGTTLATRRHAAATTWLRAGMPLGETSRRLLHSVETLDDEEQFQTLHLMFETQYTELALAVDLIAERIRSLGAPAPGSYREFGALSSVGEDDDRPDATEMIRRLVKGQETVARTARSVFPAVEHAHDEPTADLLTQRMQAHEKTAWMLRSLLTP